MAWGELVVVRVVLLQQQLGMELVVVAAWNQLEHSCSSSCCSYDSCSTSWAELVLLPVLLLSEGKLELSIQSYSDLESNDCRMARQCCGGKRTVIRITRTRIDHFKHAKSLKTELNPKNSTYSKYETIYAKIVVRHEDFICSRESHRDDKGKWFEKRVGTKMMCKSKESER